VQIEDYQFDELLTSALYHAAELDYGDLPTDDELDLLVQPSAQFQHKMSALLRNPSKYVRSRQRLVYLRVMRNVAAVFVVISILFSVTLAVSPTVRAAVVSFVRTWFADRTEYTTPENALVHEFEFAYIPEGFELTERIESEVLLVFHYKDAQDMLISVFITGGKLVVDNEHSEFSQTIISGRTVDYYESNDPDAPNMLIIFDETHDMFITLVSSISIDELERIAKHIE